MERSGSLPQEIIDILPEGCVDCPLAKYTIERAVAAEDRTGVSSTEIAENIRDNCSGWQGEPSDAENMIRGTSQPALELSYVIDEHCPYSQMTAPAEAEES